MLHATSDLTIFVNVKAKVCNAKVKVNEAKIRLRLRLARI